MSSSNLLKNLISKDINQSQNAIKNLLTRGNTEDFRELAKNSDFIFPFVREKIIKNFIKIVNKDNLETIFEFSKVYSFDFEDMIVKSWLKFANEDLTDRILELFENGTVEQKAYCAKYFSHIKDTLALDYLKEYALFDDFEPLKMNCAVALSAFRDVEILNQMKEKISSLQSEFDKIEPYKFLCAYNSIDSIRFILSNCLNSPFRVNIITYLLDFCDFEFLKNNFTTDIIAKVFNVLLEGYPEDIGLDTIEYYRIYDFINYLSNNITPYSNNLLLIAKSNFEEYFENENYHFNLDKNTKDELKEIVELLRKYKPDFSKAQELLNSEDMDFFKSALKVIEEYKLIDYAEILSSLINNNNVLSEKKGYIAQTLKALNKQSLIQKETLANIENQNIRSLIESLMV